MSQTITQESTNSATATRREYRTPAVDFRWDAEGCTLEADMPGVSKAGVEITFEDGKLTVVGRRSPEADSTPLYRESVVTDYRRVFELDPRVDASKIEANVEQGVLTLRLPKAEEAKPRRIAVS